MTFFDELRRFAGQLTHPGRKEDAGTNVESIASMTAAELLAWENRGIPNLDRASDRCETEADERQDLATSLNFPLHWTSARLSWDYLFDFSIACELLAPRRPLQARKSLRWFSNLVLVVINAVTVRLLLPLGMAGIALFAAERGWGLLNYLKVPGWLAVRWR